MFTTRSLGVTLKLLATAVLVVWIAAGCAILAIYGSYP
jgi:hypothetical protein